MGERTDGGNRLIAFVLIGAVIIAVWSWWKQSGASAAEQSVGVFVPSPESFDRRQGHLQEATQLVDLVNARHGAEETLR